MFNVLKLKWSLPWGLIVFVLASLSSGCSGNAGSSDNLGVSRQGLVPLPIRIATPNAVLPTAPALVGSNSINLGARAEVQSGSVVAMGAGGFWAEPDAISNETWSRGKATLRDRVKIRTTLHASARDIGNSVSVPTWDRNPAFDPPQVLSWQVTYPDKGARDFTLDAGQQGWIGPDRWGTININSQATLMLSTGTYYLRGLNLQSGATIQLDQAHGPVVVYVSDTLAFRGTVVPLVGTERRWLLAYLGQNPIFIESEFNGALVAPSATVTLRAVSGTHTGYFFAKDLALDAGARAKAAVPIALISVAAPDGVKCRELLANAVPEQDIPSLCPSCQPRVDSDRDGVDDCADECKFDPAKTKAGQCTCGVPETDTDGDGVPDCLDDCDLDPNNVKAGQCGCLSSRPDVLKPQAAGTRCTDTACPQAASTCNASGVCGNRTSCAPATNNCRLVQYDRSSYWICTGPATESAAAQACRSKQMALARIESYSENAFLANFAAAPLWMGANSITTSGSWRWSTATSNDGNIFWSGAASGRQENNLFSNWTVGAPATQRCAVLQRNGRWTDVDCNQGTGYVCEYKTPVVAGPITPLPGGPSQPSPMICTQTAPVLPEGDSGFDELQKNVDDANATPPAYNGAAANPPSQGGGSNSNCTNDDSANAVSPKGAGGAGSDPDVCKFVPDPNEGPDSSCFVDSDCAAGLTCRTTKDDPSCVPVPGVPCAPGDETCVPDPGVTCLGHPHCGKVTCPPLTTAICQQYDLCPPNTEFTPDSNGSNLPSVPFDAAALFPGHTLPPATTTPKFEDPSTGEGKNHSWCFMQPQQAVPNAKQGTTPNHGQAGHSTPIAFHFDPDLTFEANVNPLAMGETDFTVHARAALSTKLSLRNFLGLSTLDLDAEILSAVADIKAERCSISNSDTHFKVFGHNFADMIGIPKFDTSNLATTKSCNKALGGFANAANRAKKAFRDAQQLVSQYQAARGNLRNLCPSLLGSLGADADVPYFPDGLFCAANEPAEITINRFIDYYQAPGFGEVSRLRKAGAELSAATSALKKLQWNKRMDFGPKPKGESVTLVSAQFMIGPVPVVLQLDSFYAYGVAGYFEVGLNFPFDPFSDREVSDERVAFVRAGVMPYANAGLSAFVGAGRTLGPLSATVGLEGSVSLGDVKVPIFAGAGVNATITKDTRTRADDILKLGEAVGLGGLTHFGLPTSTKFSVWYNYGARMEVRNILKGEINGRLRIKFAFFSRTWRKRLAKFNGLDDIVVDFVNGAVGRDPGVAVKPAAIDYPTTGAGRASIEAQTIEGTTAVGYSEAQVPLLVLTPLPVDVVHDSDPGTGGSGTGGSGTGGSGSGPGTDFDPFEVRGMFYDNLCCAKPTDMPLADDRQCSLPEERPKPGEPPPCCGSLECQTIAGGGTRCVEPAGACTPAGDACTGNAECCHDFETEGRCVASSCATCIIPQVDLPTPPCQNDSDCCGGEATPQEAHCTDNICYPGPNN